jgi:hypothetical protein
MKKITLFASISLASGLLFTNLYTSLIDARSWGHDIPNSIAAAREYFKAVNPGNFFRMFSPVNQALGILTIILFWKASPAIRVFLIASVGLYILAEGLTFGYFFPRNDIMFKTAALSDVDLLKKTWSEWNTMNWVRTAILAIGVGLSFVALHKIYSRNSK